ncbi:hypothetical protein Syun_026024 [Stephania yunnanensis]|uniref:Uncharacterized protein n=1 Tax=Stephania yunnanensis TaxID=152371 RepID=A0AAP0F1M5_9MAGN
MGARSLLWWSALHLLGSSPFLMGMHFPATGTALLHQATKHGFSFKPKVSNYYNFETLRKMNQPSSRPGKGKIDQPSSGPGKRRLVTTSEPAEDCYDLLLYRCEEMNHFVNGHVNSNTILKQFITQYKVAVNRKFENQEVANFECYHKKQDLITKIPYER